MVKPSDVVFMYEAGAKTYEEYGATVLAWGGKPSARKLEEAHGVLWFASVGMVTEFAAFHGRFPDRYEEALCRDIQGQPVKVPWLTDHQSKGVPFWWCCTKQPIFQQFLRDRVIENIKAGAHGLHVDDHLGTAGGLWLGICFCDPCVNGFRAYLAGLPAEELARMGVKEPGRYDFREAVRSWLAEARDGSTRKVTDHPLWSRWSAYQCRGAAAFMQELRELAAATAGHGVPVGANAGLLWPRHLADYQSLDLFTAETDHHASARRFSDLPLVAYRMAESMGRPYAATASGGDWAFIKEQNRPGLVRGWIALSYAAGQRLMAPHHQWCHTPEKGTHWYDGPAAKFAPLYRFVRAKPDWFDGYETHADLGVVLPHRGFLRQTRRWLDLGGRLAAANLSYRILVAGDDVVDHPLTEADLRGCPALLMPPLDDLLPADRALLARSPGGQQRFQTVEEALAKLAPAVKVRSERTVRALPRVRADSLVIHLLNYDYDSKQDDVVPQEGVEVEVDRTRPGERLRDPVLLTLDGRETMLKWDEGRVRIPRLDLWALVRFAR